MVLLLVARVVLRHVPCQALHHWVHIVYTFSLRRHDLESVLHHEVQLFELRVLPISPRVHLGAKSDRLRQRFLENKFIIDFDQESELTGAAHWCHVKFR